MKQIISKLLSLSACLLALPFLASCIRAQVDDISEAEVSFVEPAANSFTNDTSYNFKIQITSTNKDITADKAVLEVYEGVDCDRSKLVSSTVLSSDSANVAKASAASALQDGKTYSARVVVTNRERIFQSRCSASVGVDTQTPNPVSVNFPAGNGFVNSKEMFTSWTTTTDNGISGLSEVPYRLRLFAAATCTGTPVQTVDSAVEQYKFKSLTQGLTYVVQVSSLDKAGNESVLACSPYIEVDVNAPGFLLSDPTSSDGYTRVTSPQISINNDGAAAYWCLTPNAAFLPTAYTDPCPSGTGTASGWYTTRPTTLPIGSGDGLKSFNLWIFRSDGSLISHNRASGAVTLDQTPPGNFAVTGVGGLADTVFDSWFTSAGQPEVHWAASSDAVDYTVDIRNAGNTLVCSMSGVTGTSIVFAGCPTLTNGATYKVRMTAFDIARNFTSAADFSFVVDRDPPGSFSIAGLTGGADVTADNFFGPGTPTVNFSTATNSSHYRVEIKDTSGVGICSLGSKADQSGFFDYASEAGMTCIGLMNGGTYQVYVGAFDDGENVTRASNDGFTFQVDTVVPTLTLDTVPAPPTSDTFAAFTFTATDSLSGIGVVQCQLDGGAYATCASPKNLTGLAEGEHTLNVKAIDAAGNFTVQSHTWRVDLTNPVLTIDSQPAAYTNSSSISVAFHAVDIAGIAKYECSLDGATRSLCTSPYGVSVSEAAHTIVIRATDNTGFYDEKTVSFTVDVTDPVLALTSVPSNPSHSTTTASIWFNTSDLHLSTVQCQLDGAAYASCSSPAGYTGLGSGSHIVNVKSTDLAGNITVQSTSWVIYNYAWITSGFSGCTAIQPSWSVGSFGGCNAVQPAYTYTNWGSCSVTCGGGTRSRVQSCPTTSGSEFRSVSCPTNSGTETRTVQCQRNDGTIVGDAFCLTAKPAASQTCSRNDCAGAPPAGSQACSRGGGSDCNTPQVTTQACNPQSCLVWHLGPFTGSYGRYCSDYGAVEGGACTGQPSDCGPDVNGMSLYCY